MAEVANSMSDQTPNYPRRRFAGGTKLHVLFGLVIVLAAANGFLYFQVDKVRAQMSRIERAILTEISRVRETSSLTTETSRKKLETLREQVQTARRQAARAAGQARKAALKHADQLANQLQAEQLKQQQQVRTELYEVGEAASSAHTKIADVSGEVSDVHTEVALTRSELERAISELRSVSGDLGIQSGLIATNAKEMAALKAIGERNYFEFNLGKTRRPHKVGTIALHLKKTDAKRSKYTIEVLADDKRVEKKNKTVNEPVQFYVAGLRQPYEIVVNEVRRNQIVGYLATPKAGYTARN
jgi:hypothetical protein